MADAILSLHRAEPDLSMREWRYSEALSRHHLEKALQAPPFAFEDTPAALDAIYNRSTWGKVIVGR